MFGKDVFLRRSELDTTNMDSGMLVSFRIMQGSKGPQATDVKVLPDGCFGAEGQQGTVFQGKVKSFNEAKGWGFVTSTEVQQMFGKDIFVHRREVGETIPAAGDPINFTVEQGPSGQLEAKNVTSAALGVYQPA